MSSSEKYECTICGWIYDQTLGAPEQGIAAGTAWQDVAAEFECPDCGIGKDYFEPLPE
jgi:rubredoxin